MNLKDLIAVSGESGLFRFIAQGRNTIIVEHIDTGKRQSVSSTARVSSLEDISIFTEAEEMKLSSVFDRIWEKENGGQAPGPKTQPSELERYFSDIVPEYDRSKVYHSDIKKVVSWYNILQKHKLLVKELPEEDADKSHEHEKQPDTHAEAKKQHKAIEKAPPVKKGPAAAAARKRVTPTARKQK